MSTSLSKQMPPVELLRHCPLLEGLQPADYESLAVETHPEELHAGQTLAEEGEPASKVFFLLRGGVELRMESLSPNVEIPVGRLGAGDVLGERLLLGEDEWPETAVAITSGEVLVIPVPGLTSLLRRDPETAALVYANAARMLARRLDRSQKRVLNVVRKARFGDDADTSE